MQIGSVSASGGMNISQMNVSQAANSVMNGDHSNLSATMGKNHINIDSGGMSDHMTALLSMVEGDSGDTKKVIKLALEMYLATQALQTAVNIASGGAQGIKG